MTARDQWYAAALTDVRALGELEGPPMPPMAERAYEVFFELSESRGATMAGPMALSFTEIDAYQRATRQRLTPLDIALLKEADRAFLAEMRDRSTPSAPEA